MATNINDLSFDDLVPSKSRYLSKSDVGEDGLLLTIKGFRMETIEGDNGDEEKMVLHFAEAVKPMVVNRTNAQLIGVATGCRTAGESKGKKIVVWFDPSIGFGGKITGGLRIRKPQGAPKPAPSAARVAGGDDDFNDPVPF